MGLVMKIGEKPLHLVYIHTPIGRVHLFIRLLIHIYIHINTRICRTKMVERNPNFTFIFKNETERGHAHSMNILMERVKTEYFVYIEDDWEYRFNRYIYMHTCMHALTHQYKRIYTHTQGSHVLRAVLVRGERNIR